MECTVGRRRSESTRIAGYNAWLKLNRYVKKGEKAIKIIIPMVKKDTDEESGEDIRRLRFGTGNVFDPLSRESGCQHQF